MAFISLCRKDNAAANNPGTTLITHRVAKYPSTLTGPAQPWDDRVFAISGDIEQQQIAIVPWVDSDFRRLQGGTRVLTTQALNQHWTGNPNDSLVGPCNDEMPDTETVYTRHCMYVPHKYTPLVIGASLTPRQAWERLHAAIHTDGKEQECKPLLDFLKVCVTREAAGTVSRVADVWPAMEQPPNAALFKFFRRMVQRDLPGAFGLAPGAQTTAHQIAASVGNLANETQAHTAGNLTQQFARLWSSQLTPPPTVSCRLWVGDMTVFSLPAPTFEAFDAAIRSIFELDTDANISYYYIATKSSVQSRKYISDDHDLKRFHFLAGKPTIFVWIRGENPSLSPDSLPSEIEIKALSVESLSDSSTSTRGHAQKLFRASVRARDKNTCVLSGEILREKTGNVQAAHIFGIERALAQERQRLGIHNAYDTQNGMLLATSLNTDFDAYLWCMDESLTVHVSEKGKKKGLGKWEGTKLNLALEGYESTPPSILKARYELFLKKAAAD